LKAQRRPPIAGAEDGKRNSGGKPAHDEGGSSMYPGKYAAARANRPAVVMAGSGEAIIYRELEARSNRLARMLRAAGLRRLDHYAIFMENHPRFVECCAAGERTGLYYTCVNSFLTAAELAYIVNNSQSKALITSQAKREIALAALANCPRVELCLIVDGPGEGARVRNLGEATADCPTTRLADESLGAAMLYSSGTTGRPKGVLRPLPDRSPVEPLSMIAARLNLWRFREGQIYLSPAPLYHSAPLAGVSGTIRRGGTVIVMERFDAERFLELVERYRVTHTQLVPTMFSRLLKLPEAVRRRYDLTSLEVAIHAAAPCPVPIKRAMIDWWGPIILEYYSATEAMGMTVCDSAEWLKHPGTVGKAVFGELHILDDAMREVPARQIGKLWFKTASPFEYFNDPVKTAEANSPDGTMSTVGDIGYVDEEGYLYLTDRATFMIISGGVNIYPQECENLLITHPKVADAAVFGVPNEDLGEEVKAVVQLAPGFEPGADMEAELVAFCRERLAHHKCPRSIDFEAELPRLPTGKLYKASLRERYWKGHKSSIV
jgi:long-chain acyl-CoA synthetase